MKKDIPRITESDKANRFKHLLSSGITPDEFNELTAHRYSRSTNLAMAKDWRVFNDFCLERSRPSLPATSPSVLEFIEHVSSKRKFSSIRRYAVTISVVHYILGYKDPTQAREVTLVMSKLKLSGKSQVKQTIPFTSAHLAQIHTKLAGSDVKKDARDLAMYYLLYECALKRRELKAMKVEDILEDDERYAVTIDEKCYPLSVEASASLRRWLVHVPYSFLFRAIDRHGNLRETQLDDSSIHRVLQRASQILGLDDSLGFSSQSGRVGAVQEKTREGMKIREIQEFGRWQSPAMPLQYSGKTSLSEQQKAIFKTKKNYD
ncbi:tyrosine-type recombinase/integrase [Vibrio maritimus]|uniref:tyrosine-type recombinase/integrase n=1 Tax=Vibrio maritimus TaxID=990268 RepID=UPI0037362826